MTSVPEEPGSGSDVALRPTKPTERHEILDVVRGFALLGVVVVNWYYTGAWSLLSLSERQALPTAGFDGVVQMVNELLFDDKFYTLFSILFGLGFALQLDRASSRGQDPLPTYRRRMAALFVLGMLHALVLYYGDILHVYAVLGFALMLFRDRSNRAILSWAATAIVVSALTPALEYVVEARWPGAGVLTGPELSRAERLVAAASEGWPGVLRLNATLLAGDYSSLWGVAEWYLGIFGRFLLGFYVGRRGFLRHFQAHVATYRRLFPWAAALGLLGNALHVGSLRLFDPPIYLPGGSLLARIAWLLVQGGILALAASYVCAIVLAYSRPTGRRVLGYLAPLGRMALSNYLGQSLAFVLLFYGVGIGLGGHVGVGIATLLAMALFFVQIPISAWWLSQFRFGPAEWLWRCITYGTWVPIRGRRR